MPAEIPIDRLSRMFTADLAAGKLFWLTAPRTHPRLVGVEAGTARRGKNGKAYWIIKIDGRAFRRSVLMYAIGHKRYASPIVDHINGDSLDDRLVNLREATVTENAWNHKHRRRRILLPMGVRLIPRSGRYQARIGVNKRQISLGAFATPEEAHAVYLTNRKEMFGDFA